MTLQNVATAGNALSGTNIQCNWVLAAYQNPGAQPGVAPDAQTARNTMQKLHQRGRLEARLRGVVDLSIVDDAIGAMFVWIAGSCITKNFQATRGLPRTYINKILRRFIDKSIHQRIARKESALDEKTPTRALDPAVAAEINEIAEKCKERLGETHEPLEKTTPETPPSRRYGKRHRDRMRRWKKIADLFPERRLRPTSRYAR